MTMRTKGVKMDFENLIARGENEKGADGFLAQTANGTASWRGEGWNKDEPWEMPQVEPGPTRPAGRSNRTAE
jgi:hypothetical protein